MKYLVFVLFWFVVQFVRFLPFWLLYRISNGIAWLLDRVLGYRAKVVEENLKRAFPEYSEAERQQIRHGFYRHLADILVEGLKGLFIAKKEVLRRYRFVNPEVVNQFYQQGQHVFAMPAHYGNWEWGVLSFSLQVQHDVIGVYKPIRNPIVEAYMAKRRSRFGLILNPFYQTRQAMENPPARPSLYIMMSDQGPSSTKKAQWVEFFGQDTACLHGADYYSRKLNYPVLFMDVQRVKRGFYEITFSVLFDQPAQTEEPQVTETYMKKLEEVIRKKPEDWLWSHRRWKPKHRRPLTASGK
jgi:KDO2-lipid IV(A) lauroyltransferase